MKNHIDWLVVEKITCWEMETLTPPLPATTTCHALARMLAMQAPKLRPSSRATASHSPVGTAGGPGRGAPEVEQQGAEADGAEADGAEADVVSFNFCAIFFWILAISSNA